MMKRRFAVCYECGWKPIPLGARIVGVADAYDELVSGDGHPPVAPSDAVEILSTERHREFDPLVLEALKKLQPVPHVQR